MADHTREELIEAFEYLDDLRMSGITNMFGAGPYVVRDLCWDPNEARSATILWMETFNGDPVEQRVEVALEK